MFFTDIVERSEVTRYAHSTPSLPTGNDVTFELTPMQRINDRLPVTNVVIYCSVPLESCLIRMTCKQRHPSHSSPYSGRKHQGRRKGSLPSISMRRTLLTSDPRYSVGNMWTLVAQRQQCRTVIDSVISRHVCNGNASKVRVSRRDVVSHIRRAL